MYTIANYYRESKGNEVVEREYRNIENFRLRRNALRYVLEIVQSYYKEKGYATETIKSGINCYKSEKDSQGERKIIELQIKVEKA